MRAESYGLGEWADQLDAAGKDIIPQVKKVTGQGMNNIKKGAQRRVHGYPHLPHLARSFTYDVTARGTLVVGEVGAEHEKPQGKLDVFIEFGTPTSAPIPHWRPEHEKELPVWIDYLEQACVDAIEAGRDQ